MNHRLIALAAISAAAVVLASPASAAIVYDVNFNIGNATITGTLTTDGVTASPLSAADITSFDLFASLPNGPPATAEFTPGNSTLTVGSGLTASLTQLSFDFGMSNQFEVAQSLSTLINLTSFATVKVLFGDTDFSVSFRASGEEVLGQVAAVPELSTWAMMVLGFVGLGFMAHRRKQNAPALSVA